MALRGQLLETQEKKRTVVSLHTRAVEDIMNTSVQVQGFCILVSPESTARGHRLSLSIEIVSASARRVCGSYSFMITPELRTQQPVSNAWEHRRATPTQA